VVRELLVEAVIPRLTVDRVLLAILPGMNYFHWFAGVLHRVERGAAAWARQGEDEGCGAVGWVATG
jgi:hypothetical protein